MREIHTNISIVKNNYSKHLEKKLVKLNNRNNN